MLPRLLIITRNYPPQTGGLESYSFNLIRELRRQLPLRVIALSRGKRHLVWFLAYALAVGLVLILGLEKPPRSTCATVFSPLLVVG